MYATLTYRASSPCSVAVVVLAAALDHKPGAPPRTRALPRRCVPGLCPRWPNSPLSSEGWPRAWELPEPGITGITHYRIILATLAGSRHREPPEALAGHTLALMRSQGIEPSQARRSRRRYPRWPWPWARMGRVVIVVESGTLAAVGACSPSQPERSSLPWAVVRCGERGRGHPRAVIAAGLAPGRRITAVTLAVSWPWPWLTRAHAVLDHPGRCAPSWPAHPGRVLGRILGHSVASRSLAQDHERILGLVALAQDVAVIERSGPLLTELAGAVLGLVASSPAPVPRASPKSSSWPPGRGRGLVVELAGASPPW